MLQLVSADVNFVSLAEEYLADKPCTATADVDIDVLEAVPYVSSHAALIAAQTAGTSAEQPVVAFVVLVAVAKADLDVEAFPEQDTASFAASFVVQTALDVAWTGLAVNLVAVDRAGQKPVLPLIQAVEATGSLVEPLAVWLVSSAA